MNTVASAFIAGLLFGLGLIVSGMTDPSKVIAFLDLTGSWDPSLALVMGGAIVASWIGIRLADGQASEPTGSAGNDHAVAETTPAGDAASTGLSSRQTTDDAIGARGIDRQLISGSALFGVGWGITGFCPGPMVVGLGLGFWPAAAATLTMLAGLRAGAWITSARSSG